MSETYVFFYTFSLINSIFWCSVYPAGYKSIYLPVQAHIIFINHHLNIHQFLLVFGTFVFLTRLFGGATRILARLEPLACAADKPSPEAVCAAYLVILSGGQWVFPAAFALSPYPRDL